MFKILSKRSFSTVQVTNRAGKAYNAPDKLIINGEYVAAKSGKTFDNISPSTEQVINQVASAQKEDVDAAVESCLSAAKEWKKVSNMERSAIMNKFADIIDEHADELITLECEDMGKTYEEATFDMNFTSTTIRYYAGLATHIGGSSFQRDSGMWPNTYGYTRKEPIGVCGMITPWNFPALMTAWKIGPMLASGCTGISKPPEIAPLSSLKLVELWNKTPGVIPGVLNCLPGIGEVTGEAMTDHPGIRKIAFTGSGVRGKHIMKKCADSMKRVTLELGGKGPLIVFDDADLEKAVNIASFMGYLNSGQFCAAPTRLIVQDSIHDQFVEKMVEKAAAMKPGYWKDEGVTRGPIVSEKQMNTILNYIDIGKKEGAEVAVGGTRLDRPGYFVEPTLFINANNQMRSVREEIFGPVLSVLKFSDADEALSIANDSNYGLSGGVFTNDMKKANRVASEMEQGNVNINTYFSLWVDTPFGGFKESGIGRELSENGLDNYLETKAVLVDCN